MPNDPIQAMRTDSQQVTSEAHRLSRLEGRRVDHLGFAVKTARLADVVWSMGDELSGRVIQQALFDDAARIDPRTLSARTDPDTSREAATKAVASGVVGRQQEEVLAALKTFGPCTACELAKWAGIDRFTCSRRLPELADPKVGKVERLPARVCSVAGSKQTVWRVR